MIFLKFVNILRISFWLTLACTKLIMNSFMNSTIKLCVNHEWNHILLCLIFLTVSVIGTITYSEVRTYLKKVPDITINYRSISFWNETLILTGNHLVYARSCKEAGKFNPM